MPKQLMLSCCQIPRPIGSLPAEGYGLPWSPEPTTWGQSSLRPRRQDQASTWSLCVARPSAWVWSRALGTVLQIKLVQGVSPKAPASMQGCQQAEEQDALPTCCYSVTGSCPYYKAKSLFPFFHPTAFQKQGVFYILRNTIHDKKWY